MSVLKKENIVYHFEKIDFRRERSRREGTSKNRSLQKKNVERKKKFVVSC